MSDALHWCVLSFQAGLYFSALWWFRRIQRIQLERYAELTRFLASRLAQAADEIAALKGEPK